MNDNNMNDYPTREEIKNMSYLELWGVRRKNGAFYYIFYLSFIVFFLLCFIQICIIFYKKDNFQFIFQIWFVPVSLLVGWGYWEIHERLYKKYVLEAKDKKKNEKEQ